MKSKTKLFLQAVFLAAPFCANALTVVDFTMTSGLNASAPAPDNSTDFGDTWDFSSVSPLIDGSSNTGSNLVVYGGVKTTWSVSTDYTPNVRILAAGNLNIQNNPGGASQTTSNTGVLLWNKSDFLDGGDVVDIGFDSEDSLSINIATLGGTDRDVRFVVAQGGSYYVSGTIASAAGSHSLSDLDNQTWFDINVSDYTIASSGSLVEFNNVTGLGIYWTQTRSGNNSAAQTIFAFDDFVATGVEVTAIPEVSTLSSLLGLAGVLIIGLRRRK